METHLHGKISLLNNGSGLLVNLAGPGDGGIYSCRAENLAGNLTRQAWVEIARVSLWEHSVTAQSLVAVILVVSSLVIILFIVVIYCCRRHQVIKRNDHFFKTLIDKWRLFLKKK